MIAIHKTKGGFDERWISYCKENSIPFKIVDCYKSDIIDQLKTCKGLMWHFHQGSPRDKLMARQLIFSLEHAGFKVFPNFKSAWHFDDKVGQKYLLEAIAAPLIPSYVFYDRIEALEWVKRSVFPKVFKLRGGASSANVRLVKNRRQAIRIINKAFSSGFRQYNPWSGLKERWRIFRLGKSGYYDLFKGLMRILLKTEFEKVTGKDRNYVYFQDFIEGCSFDLRVKVIGNKCWAFKRHTRKNDFRASGSHSLVFSRDEIPISTVKTAFEVSKKLNLQCIAFDFLITGDNIPMITEMSYAFGYDIGENYGYWDLDLNWHEGEFNPFGWMVENLKNELDIVN